MNFKKFLLIKIDSGLKGNLGLTLGRLNISKQ